MSKVSLLLKGKTKLIEVILFSTFIRLQYRRLDGQLCAHTPKGRQWLVVHYVILDVRSVL